MNPTGQFLTSNKEGKLFGSVTSLMIADAIVEKGFEIDKKEIQNFKKSIDEWTGWTTEA